MLINESIEERSSVFTKDLGKHSSSRAITTCHVVPFGCKCVVEID
jgi:hypothetical protein